MPLRAPEISHALTCSLDNLDGMCLLYGTKWIFKQSYFVFEIRVMFQAVSCLPVAAETRI
jgi:hypothetical protein